MAEKTTWIKVDRNILEWGWYKDANTFRVFMHLLLTANIKPHKFLGVEVQRGEVATSYKSLAESLGISIRSVRTSLLHLETTGEVTIRRHSRFSVISIPNYDLYQANRQSLRQSVDTQVTVNRQQSKKEEERKNIRERASADAGVSPSLEEVISYQREAGIEVDPEAFWNYYEGNGWMRGSSPVRNWKAVMRGWVGKPVYKQEKTKAEEIDEVTRRWLEQ